MYDFRKYQYGTRPILLKRKFFGEKIRDTPPRKKATEHIDTTELEFDDETEPREGDKKLDSPKPTTQDESNGENIDELHRTRRDEQNPQKSEPSLKDTDRSTEHDSVIAPRPTDTVVHARPTGPQTGKIRKGDPIIESSDELGDTGSKEPKPTDACDPARYGDSSPRREYLGLTGGGRNRGKNSQARR